MIIWKPVVCVCLKCVKEPTNEVDENAVAVVCTNSHCKEEVVCDMQQNISMIMSMFLFLPDCTLVKYFNHGREYRLEIPSKFSFLGT